MSKQRIQKAKPIELGLITDEDAVGYSLTATKTR